MCGVLGAFRLTARAVISKARLFHLSINMESRGKDATGLAWTEDDGKSLYLKDAKRARDVAWTYVMESMPRSKVVASVIGHSRATTHGSEKENANNHPHFGEYGAEKNIVSVVHNGTVGNYLQIAKQHGVQLGTQCDSELFAAMFGKYFESDGAIGAMTKILESVSSGAVIYMTPHGIGIHRSGGNPMFIGVANEVAYLSSEKSYLLDINCINVHEVTPNVAVWFAKSPSGNFYLKAEMGATVPPKIVVTTNYAGNYRQHGNYRGGGFTGIVEKYCSSQEDGTLGKAWERICKRAKPGKDFIPLEMTTDGDVKVFYDPSCHEVYKHERSSYAQHWDVGDWRRLTFQEVKIMYPDGIMAHFLGDTDTKDDVIIHGSKLPEYK